MDNSILQHNDQHFVGPRKYIHSITLMTATNANSVTVEINKMIRGNYVLVDYETSYGFVKHDDVKLWINPVTGRPPAKTIDQLPEFDRWLFTILENFRYMHQRLEVCKIFTMHATASKDIFIRGVDAKNLEYRLRQDADFWYFSALHGNECAYSSTNLKK